MKKIAIGGGQGFWGDSPDAAIHMIRKADIQYLGCDYLAELTLSIMAKQQLKDPTKGYAPDFVTRLLKEAGKEAWEKNIKITTNAGGMNIEGSKGNAVLAMDVARDDLLARAAAAGGRPGRPAREEDARYTGSFADPDGNVWEVVWIDQLHVVN